MFYFTKLLDESNLTWIGYFYLVPRSLSNNVIGYLHQSLTLSPKSLFRKPVRENHRGFYLSGSFKRDTVYISTPCTPVDKFQLS